MKKTWIMGLLILSNSVFGQIPGKSFDGPIVVLDTLTINKGDIIYLGNGSDLETGNFKYLYAPKNKTIPIVKDIISGFFSENSESSSNFKLLLQYFNEFLYFPIFAQFTHFFTVFVNSISVVSFVLHLSQ